LYPCLKDLLARGWIAEEVPANHAARPLGGRRAKIVYALTADGKDRFAELIAEAGPSEWEDDSFGIRFAFFGRTDAAVRLRILEGRRRRLEEHVERVRSSATRTRERLDAYTLELQRHGLESVEREVRWLNELIATEQRGTERGTSPGPNTTRDAEQQAGGRGHEATEQTSAGPAATADRSPAGGSPSTADR
jgi:DNA-binding PadR family transcriptional regulator